MQRQHQRHGAYEHFGDVDTGPRQVHNLGHIAKSRGQIMMPCILYTGRRCTLPPCRMLFVSMLARAKTTALPGSRLRYPLVVDGCRLCPSKYRYLPMYNVALGFPKRSAGRVLDPVPPLRACLCAGLRDEGRQVGRRDKAREARVDQPEGRQAATVTAILRQTQRGCGSSRNGRLKGRDRSRDTVSCERCKPSRPSRM